MAFQYSELVYLYANEANIVNKDSPIGSISAALSCLVYPPREEIRGRSAGSFPEQRLVTEPNSPIDVSDLLHGSITPR